MIARLKVTLDQTEYSSLLKLAVSELRNPSDQLRYMLRQELEKRGLLGQDQTHDVPMQNDQPTAQSQKDSKAEISTSIGGVHDR